MISRYGQPIRVYWADFEVEWIEAANTLDRAERLSAIRDISSMTGRPYEQVRDFAARRREQEWRQRAALQRRPAQRKLVMHLPREWTLPPSELRQPTKKQLMAGRA